MYELISGLSKVFHWSTCPLLCKYHLPWLFSCPHPTSTHSTTVNYLPPWDQCRAWTWAYDGEWDGHPPCPRGPDILLGVDRQHSCKEMQEKGDLRYLWLLRKTKGYVVESEQGRSQRGLLYIGMLGNPLWGATCEVWMRGQPCRIWGKLCSQRGRICLEMKLIQKGGQGLPW